MKKDKLITYFIQICILATCYFGATGSNFADNLVIVATWLFFLVSIVASIALASALVILYKANLDLNDLEKEELRKSMKKNVSELPSKFEMAWTTIYAMTLTSYLIYMNHQVTAVFYISGVCLLLFAISIFNQIIKKVRGDLGV